MRLFVDITAHGWGHLAQTAPILDALRSRMPNFECVVRSGIPESVLRDKLGSLTAFHPSGTDFGVAMKTPFAVDPVATLERYHALHVDYDEHVDALAKLIRHERCDLVLSNVGYLALDAAKRAGVPAVACSSLEWGGMFRFYCSDLTGAREIADVIDAAYASADGFVQLLPSMTIDRWPTLPVEQAIVRLGTSNRADLCRHTGAKPEDVIALCAFGGMLPDHPPLHLLGVPGLVLIGPDAWRAKGLVSLGRVGISYQDVLASVDVVVAKPGYGTVVELGCLGKPSVMVSRGDWPEEKAHLTWLAQHTAVELRPTLDSVTATDLTTLATLPRSLPPARSGGEIDVADLILAIAARRPSPRKISAHKGDA